MAVEAVGGVKVLKLESYQNNSPQHFHIIFWFFVISILFIHITYINISRDEKIVIDLKECLIKECVINNFVVTYINNLFLLSLNVLCSIKIYFVN